MTGIKQLKRAALATSVLTALAMAPPAGAALVFDALLTQNGTGLGAVPTILTVLDNGAGGNGTESGCVSANGAGANFACLNGLQGGDNQAINNLITASSLAGIQSAGQLALVVNLNEEGNDKTATVTDLYLAFFNAAGTLIGNHQYLGPDLVLQQDPGIGSAGSVFRLDAAEVLQAAAQCPDLTQCRVGAGIQFANGSTSGGPESLFLSYVGAPPPTGKVPEPGTLMLSGLGLIGLAALRKRKAK